MHSVPRTPETQTTGPDRVRPKQMFHSETAGEGSEGQCSIARAEARVVRVMGLRIQNTIDAAPSTSEAAAMKVTRRRFTGGRILPRGGTARLASLLAELQFSYAYLFPCYCLHFFSYPAKMGRATPEEVTSGLHLLAREFTH
jgi:hypothetical protein